MRALRCQASDVPQLVLRSRHDVENKARAVVLFKRNSNIRRIARDNVEHLQHLQDKQIAHNVVAEPGLVLITHQSSQAVDRSFDIYAVDLHQPRADRLAVRWRRRGYADAIHKPINAQQQSMRRQIH